MMHTTLKMIIVLGALVVGLRPGRVALRATRANTFIGKRVGSDWNGGKGAFV